VTRERNPASWIGRVGAGGILSQRQKAATTSTTTDKGWLAGPSACLLPNGTAAKKKTPPLRRDLGEERFEHPPCLLGPRLDGAADLADMTGGGAGIG
jgi:hypothetical protein